MLTQVLAGQRKSYGRDRGSRDRDPTVAVLLDRLRQEYRLQERKSLADAEYHWKPLYRALGALRASQVDGDALQGYVLARKAEGRTNATVNRELSGLRRAFHVAHLAGLVPEVPPFPTLRETGLREGTYTRAEAERMAAALPPHYGPVFWFAYHTGRRRGEILQIRKEDVNLKEGIIRIRATTTKTGSPDRIPLIGELLTLTQQLMAQDTASPWLFNYHGKRFEPSWRTWRDASRKAGLAGKTFHDTRRTAATDLIRAGVPEKVAMAVTGHKTASVFKRYHIVDDQAVAQGFEKLQQFRGHHD